MGQYYYPILLGEQKKEGHEIIKGWLYSHEYNNGLKLLEHSWNDNDFMNAVETLIADDQPFYKTRLVWGGDYADIEEGIGKNLHALCNDENKLTPKAVIKKYRYIVNHTKKEFVDKQIGLSGNTEIHPLPILTCEGNGRGGGDCYDDELLPYIGLWARDRVSVSNSIPPGFKPIPQHTPT